MRLICQDHSLLPSQRPFAGGIGASLYLGDGDPLTDPGPVSILYRRNTILDGSDQPVLCGEIHDFGAASYHKSPAVDQVTSPTEEMAYAIPAALYGRVVWAQVRTFKDDVENESLYRPRRIVLDGSGGDAAEILGTARVTELLALDGGGVLVRFIYDAVRDGAQPEQFALSRTAGPTSPLPGVTLFVAGQRRYELTIASLQDAGAYTFTIRGEAAATSKDLVIGITFTADGDGPPAVSGLSAVEY
ncbi:MAG: hypothetical protein A3E01_10725 [Gammaproteobacteria bacterium RIFCSPHIGHO2_12_FULL_63_22]|nr:MAG: hypothetical protein A3E01_10725 [Gammaproteobacteria bacterium RIFCSPHIGHO2_12_FULL_63_22]